MSIFTNQTLIYNCYLSLVKHFRVKINYHSESQPLYVDRCIYLANHRGIADLFIDGYLTRGAGYLGKIKVLYFFFWSVILSLYNGSMVILPNKYNRQDIYSRSLKMLKKRNLIVYPEGSRNIQNDSLPLKYGFIKLAYDNDLPVQIILTNKKEFVTSMLLWTANYDVSCQVIQSAVLYPDRDQSLQEWTTKVKKTWYECWKKVYPYSNPPSIQDSNSPTNYSISF